MDINKKPYAIVIFSGKRKTGKDYVTEQFQDCLGRARCSILQLSGPLKNAYAKEHNLDFSKLLESSEYKEQFRLDMIKWGEAKRATDPGYFCRIISQEPGAEKSVWLISDARRKTDVQYFQVNYPGKVLVIRVTADDSVRETRGWKFIEGIDDSESECGLDHGVDFDFTILNNGSLELDRQLKLLQDDVLKLIPK